MSKFCVYCGKSLAEGEACSCQNQQAQGQAPGQQAPPQGQWQGQQAPPQGQWQGQQAPPQGQWQGQQAPPQGQWQAQQGYYMPPRQPNPNGFGNRFGQLMREFFVAPVNAVFNQVRRGSMSVALFILGITAGVKLLFGLIYALIHVPKVPSLNYLDEFFWSGIPTYGFSRTGLIVGNMFAFFLDEIFFLGVLILGLFLFTMAFTKKKLNIGNAVIVVGCSALILPVVYILGLIPYVNVPLVATARFFTILLAILAYQAIEGIEDKSKVAYIGLCTMGSYYLISLLLGLIFKNSFLSVF